jgi:hypothetical protein
MIQFAGCVSFSPGLLFLVRSILCDVPFGKNCGKFSRESVFSRGLVTINIGVSSNSSITGGDFFLDVSFTVSAGRKTITPQGSRLMLPAGE